MLSMFFTDKSVKNFQDAKTSDTKRFAKFYTAMRERGIYLAPSQFEALFVSAAHSQEDIDETVRAAAEVFEMLKQGG